MCYPDFLFECSTHHLAITRSNWYFGLKCIKHDFRTYQHDVSHETPDYENFRPFFGWVNVDTVQKTMEQSTQWGVSLPNTFPMKRDLKSRNPALNIPERIPAKKEPCLTLTLMDEGQARDPNTTYNGYILEFWKFALTLKLICQVQQKITQKGQKETTKEGGISLTIMGQKSIYNSINKLQRSPNETIGINQDDQTYIMSNETGIPVFLELQILGIPMVMMVTSRARSLHDPTQQDFVNARTLPIYKCHTRFKF